MILVEVRKLLQRFSTRMLLTILFTVNAFLVWNLQLPGTESYIDYGAEHILSLYAALPDDAEQAVASLEHQNDILLRSIFSDDDSGSLLTGDVYVDRRLFLTLIERVSPIADYESTLSQIEENSRILLMSGQYEAGSFGYRNILKSQDTYRHLSAVQPVVFYSGAVELLPGGRATDILLVLLCLLVGLELVGYERSSGTLALIKPTYKGGYPLICAKIVAGLFLVAIFTLILYGSNLIIGLVRCGSFPVKAPLQSVFGFARSPWKISVGAYIAGFVLFKYLWIASVMAMIYVSCCLGRNALKSCGIFLISLAPSLVKPSSAWSVLSTGNTTELFATYRNLNIAGWPVSHVVFSFFVLLMTCFIGFLMALVLHAKLPLIETARRNHRFRGKYRVSASLFWHEVRKVLLLNGAIWVLAGLVCVQLITYFSFDAYIHPQERLYMQYSDVLAGNANPEKDAYIASEETRFEELYSKLEEYTDALSQGEISQEAYSTLCSAIARQLDDEVVFQRAKNQYEQTKLQGYEYVCLTGYERLFGTVGQQDLIMLTIKLMITLILGLSSIHSVETETNMILLLHSVPRHRDSIRIKGAIASAYAVVAALITYFPHIFIIAKKYGLGGLFASYHSVPQLTIGFHNVICTLLAYWIVLVSLAVIVSQIISWISGRSKNIISTILFSSTLLIPLFCCLLT